MNEFELLRGKRRSFFCHNKFWQELLKETDDCISISTYIGRAIVEKMCRENPQRHSYYTSLL